MLGNNLSATALPRAGDLSSPVEPLAVYIHLERRY